MLPTDINFKLKHVDEKRRQETDIERETETDVHAFPNMLLKLDCSEDRIRSESPKIKPKTKEPKGQK